MSPYYVQDSFEPPLTTQEKRQHWGIPPLPAGPIARPLAHGQGDPLLPALAKNLKANMATEERTGKRTGKHTGKHTVARGENTLASPPAVILDHGFRFGIEQRARQLQAQVLWDFTATFSRKAAGWIKRVAGGIFGRSGVGSAAQGAGKKPKTLTGADMDLPRDYWERRARFFGAGL